MVALGGLDPRPIELELSAREAHAMACFHAGRASEAAEELEACLALNPRRTAAERRRAAGHLFELALCAARSGAVEGRLPDVARTRVLELLVAAAEAGYDRPDIVARHPALAPLAGDPELEAILGTMR